MQSDSQLVDFVRLPKRVLTPPSLPYRHDQAMIFIMGSCLTERSAPSEASRAKPDVGFDESKNKDNFKCQLLESQNFVM